MALTKGLHEPIHEPVHEPVRAALPDFANMSEDELLAYVQQQESGDQYTIPYGIEPDGMSYQWKRHEVYGKPDYANMSDLEQKGWRAVPQSRHDGRWMPPGTSGPTLRDGLMLMEIPTPLLRAKETMRNRSAVQQVDSMTERLSYTAPGAAPRTAHPKTMPVVRREMVQIEVAP